MWLPRLTSSLDISSIRADRIAAQEEINRNITWENVLDLNVYQTKDKCNWIVNKSGKNTQTSATVFNFRKSVKRWIDSAI